MKRTAIVIVVASLLFVALQHYLNRPTLTILIDGVPAASVAVTDIPTWKTFRTDDSGRVCIPVEGDSQHAIQFTDSTGRSHLMAYPARGHATVNICGRYIVSKTVFYDYGVIRKTSEETQYSLSDEESAAIKSGESTVEAVKQRIQE